MRKRRIIVRRRTKWTVEEWERGWELAMSRIHGAPTIVRNACIFQDCLTVLNGAFADGNGLQFELGLNGLMDLCADSIEIGDCEQWWCSPQ
jgi:hypothetical protein